MTVLTMGSYHVFGEKTDFLGETLLKKESGWVSHFSSFFIIDLFHHVWDIQTHLSWVIFFLVPLVSPGYRQLQVHTLVSPWYRQLQVHTLVSLPGWDNREYIPTKRVRRRRGFISPLGIHGGLPGGFTGFILIYMRFILIYIDLYRFIWIYLALYEVCSLPCRGDPFSEIWLFRALF